MMNPTSAERLRADSRLIGQTLRKLSAPKLLLRAIVAGIAVLVWLWVGSVILNFGRRLDYAALSALGQQAVDLMTTIGPYLWLAVVAIWSLIVFFSVRAWINAHIESSRSAPVDADTFSQVAQRVSPETRDVLSWSWANRDEPFTLGDLRRAQDELNHGRVDKLAIVREQTALLQGRGLTNTAAATDRPDRSTADAASQARPAASRRGPVEPRLGNLGD